MPKDQHSPPALPCNAWGHHPLPTTSTTSPPPTPVLQAPGPLGSPGPPSCPCRTSSRGWAKGCSQQSASPSLLPCRLTSALCGPSAHLPPLLPICPQERVTSSSVSICTHAASPAQTGARPTAGAQYLSSSRNEHPSFTSTVYGCYAKFHFV